MATRDEFITSAADLRFRVGFSVIPLIAGTKKPIVSWEKYQKERAGYGEILLWWSAEDSRNNKKGIAEVCNLGIVCGSISDGLVVLDVDPRKGGSLGTLFRKFGLDLTEAVMVETGGGGWHIYYKAPKGKIINTMVLLPGIEVRSEGAIVVAPPSIHPDTGKEYKWVCSPFDREIEPLPFQIMQAIEKKKTDNTVSVKGYGPEPTDEIVRNVLREVLLSVGEQADSQSEAINHYILGKFDKRRDKEIDRSGWSYTLARLLLEKGIVAQDDHIRLATVVYGSNVHKSKFKNRADRWQDACRIADVAINADYSEGIDEFTEVIANKYKIPPFPEKICTGLIGEIAHALDEISEAPLAYLYHALMTCFSIYAAGSVTLNTNLKVKPTLYTILLGHSSHSRKSTAMDKAIDFFGDALGDNFYDRTYQGFFGSGEGVLKKLADVGQKNSRGLANILWCVDEFEQVIARSTMEHSILAPLLQTLYESDRFEYTTVTRNVRVTNAYLSLLSSSTIDTFASMWEKRLTEGGLLNRLWLVAPHPAKKLVLPPELGAEGERLKEDLRELLWSLEQGPVIKVGGVERRLAAEINTHKIPLTTKALDLWTDFYLEEFPILTEEAPEAARRLETYGLRFALLTALSRKEFEGISRDTLERVIALLKYEFSVRKALKPLDAKSDTAKIEQLICRKLCEGQLTKRDLYRSISGHRYGAGLFERALDNLARIGFIHIERKGKQALITLVDTLD